MSEISACHENNRKQIIKLTHTQSQPAHEQRHAALTGCPLYSSICPVNKLVSHSTLYNALPCSHSYNIPHKTYPILTFPMLMWGGKIPWILKITFFFFYTQLMKIKIHSNITQHKRTRSNPFLVFVIFWCCPDMELDHWGIKKNYKKKKQKTHNTGSFVKS